MIFATGIGLDAESNGLVASTIDEKGTQGTVPIEGLHAKGMPEGMTLRMRTLHTDFAGWRIEPADRYLSALGFSVPHPVHHWVYCFEYKGHEFLVPALALMRAVFYPARWTLREIFLPGGLDRFCIPCTDGAGVAIEPGRSGMLKNRNTSVFLNALAWLNYCPSARAMADSVHDYATRGELGLSLPNATAKVVSRHVIRRGLRCVVDLWIHGVESVERRELFDGSIVGSIPLHGFSTPASLPVPPRLVCRDLPCRSDGRTCVSDEEWSELEHLFASRRRKHDPRALLDGVLEKLITGTSWRATIYRTGTVENAANSYKLWKASGRWDAVRTVLLAHRRTSRNSGL